VVDIREYSLATVLFVQVVGYVQFTVSCKRVKSVCIA